METSRKFAFIENNFTKLLGLILDNQNIKKYIYYLGNDPLSQPDVESNLIETGHIVLTMFDGEIETEEKIKMYFYPAVGDLRSDVISNITFELDILIPISKWLLHGQGLIRPFRIMDEISQLIDQQKVAGIKEAKITDFRCFRVEKSNYGCLSALIKIKSSAMKGLR